MQHKPVVGCVDGSIGAVPQPQLYERPKVSITPLVLLRQRYYRGKGSYRPALANFDAVFPSRSHLHGKQTLTVLGCHVPMTELLP